MPPRTLSRHTYTRIVVDDEGRRLLTRREPYRFRVRSDNETHIVSRGDTLNTIAGRKYRSIDPERACGLWWVIADYQPNPIHDPTIELREGQALILPSVRVVNEEIFNERRREEA